MLATDCYTIGASDAQHPEYPTVEAREAEPDGSHTCLSAA